MFSGVAGMKRFFCISCHGRLPKASVCLLGVYFASGWPKAKRKSRLGVVGWSWSLRRLLLLESAAFRNWNNATDDKMEGFCRSMRGLMTFEVWITFVLKGLKGCFGNDNNLRPIEQPHDSSVRGRLVQHLQERVFCKTQTVLLSGF